MKSDEVEAIERAILAGIDAMLENVLVRPFPEKGDLRTQIFHARGSIRDAVDRELRRIRPER
jgi:hypothetical protein